MSWSQLLYMALLATVSAFIANRTLGARRPDRRWPHWAERLGDRDIPTVVGSDWFGEIAVLVRRALPLLGALTFLEAGNYISGKRPVTGISAVDWLSIYCLGFACFTAYMPFAKKPRRGPLDKWAMFFQGLILAAGGIVFSGFEIAIHLANPAPDRGTAIGRAAMWAAEHSLSESLGYAANVIGIGIGSMALIEGLPRWRDAPMTLTAPGNTQPTEVKRLPGAPSTPRPDKLNGRNKRRSKRRRR